MSSLSPSSAPSNPSVSNLADLRQIITLEQAEAVLAAHTDGSAAIADALVAAALRQRRDALRPPAVEPVAPTCPQPVTRRPKAKANSKYSAKDAGRVRFYKQAGTLGVTSGTATRLWCWLWEIAKKGVVFTANSRLADQLTTDPTTIGRALACLQKAGLVTLVYRGVEGESDSKWIVRAPRRIKTDTTTN